MIEQWHEQYAGELTRFIQSRGFSVEEAEDLCSKVFLETVQSKPEDISARGWLYQSARWRMAEHWRRKRVETVPLIEVAAVETATLDLEPLLSQLTVRERVVIESRFIVGRSIAETAAHLGLSVPVVKARQRYGLRRLRGETTGRRHVQSVDAVPDARCADGRMTFLTIDGADLCAVCALVRLGVGDEPRAGAEWGLDNEST